MTLPDLGVLPELAGFSGPDAYTHVYPATGEPTAEFRGAGLDEVAAAVERARVLAAPWRALSLSERGRRVAGFADAMREDGERLSALRVVEGGVPVQVAGQLPDAAAALVDDAVQCAPCLEDHGASGGALTRQRLPFGVVGVITPWNAPLTALAQAAAAALVAGNAVVAKPSERAPFSSIRLAQLAERAGLPLVPLVGGPRAGEALVRHPDVDLVHLTGGLGTARQVLATAADRVAPTLLELGGKAPLVVVEDADLGIAAGLAVRGVALLSGQGCTNVARVLVHRSLEARLSRLIRGMLRRVTLGDPMDPSTAMGPLIAAVEADRVVELVRSTVAAGDAELLCGGERASGPLARGAFVLPTILAQVRRGAPIAQTEVFGPVLAMQSFDDDDEAVALANDTPYGLSAYVASGDPARARGIAARLVAGNVWINGVPETVAGIPMGGVAASGWGRLGGPEGVLQFTRLRTVWSAL